MYNTDINSNKGTSMQAYDIYLGDRLIDTVFFQNGVDENYVKDALVNHDDYHPLIVVKAAKETV